MVLYLVCFDLSAHPDDQRRQIDSWLSYLNSLLVSNDHKAAWKVIIVGTRADKQHPLTIKLQSTFPFQQLFPSMPLHDSIFYTSTLHDTKSIKHLFQTIEDECNQIMNNHAKYLPNYYKELRNDITSLSSPTSPFLEVSSLQSKWKESIEYTKEALQHLHAIGEIVMFGNNKIFTNPEVLSKLMAKFISPAEVKAKLLGDRARVFLLKSADIKALLEVRDTRLHYFNSFHFSSNLVLILGSSKTSWSCSHTSKFALR